MAAGDNDVFSPELVAELGLLPAQMAHSRKRAAEAMSGTGVFEVSEEEVEA